MFPIDLLDSAPDGANSGANPASHSPLLTGLNDEQLAAVTLPAGHALILAGAGSGKTRVLVDRIIRQLIDGEFDVDAMLVVTFTNAAAAEMRERIETALQATLRQVDDVKLADRLERQVVLLTGANICTFHSFCQKVIRQHIEAIDVDPQFRLAGEQEMVLLAQKSDVAEELDRLSTHIRRVADQLAISRLLDSSGELARLKQLSGMADRVNALFSDAATNVAGVWSNFFDSVSGPDASSSARFAFATSSMASASRRAA